MQISSGIAKGLKIKVTPGLETRPTSARVRQAILNSLQQELSGATILELFAGSGALGLEALSRGAASCTFVEKAKPAVDVLRGNVQAYLERVTRQNLDRPTIDIIVTDVFQAVESLTKNKRTFSLVFADPPYEIGPDWWRQSLNKLTALLYKDAKVLIETNSVGGKQLRDFFKEKEEWYVERDKNYGNTTVIMFRYKSSSKD